MTHPLSKHKGPYRAGDSRDPLEDADCVYDASGYNLISAWDDDLAADIADHLNRAEEMERALREITTASEMDCGVPTADDGDDEPVAATQAQHGPIVGSALTFGMLRRARAALPPTPESET